MAGSGGSTKPGSGAGTNPRVGMSGEHAQVGDWVREDGGLAGRVVARGTLGKNVNVLRLHNGAYAIQRMSQVIQGVRG